MPFRPVWLEKRQHQRSNYELESAVNLPSPRSAHQLLQIVLPLPNLISDGVGRAGRLRRSIFAQTGAHHTSLSQLSGPVAFTARLENGAIKSMSETSALLLLDSLDPLILLQIRTLVHISQDCDLDTQISSVETTTIQCVPECLAISGPRSCRPIKSSLCLHPKRLHEAIRRFIYGGFRLQTCFWLKFWNMLCSVEKPRTWD